MEFPINDFICIVVVHLNEMKNDKKTGFAYWKSIYFVTGNQNLAKQIHQSDERKVFINFDIFFVA